MKEKDVYKKVKSLISQQEKVSKKVDEKNVDSKDKKTDNTSK